MTIPRRIFLGFALILSAFAVVASLSLAQHARTVRTLRLLDEGYLPLALTLGEAKATQAVFATLLNQLEPQELVSPQGWLEAVRAVRPTTLRRAYGGLDRARRLSVEAGLAGVTPPLRPVQTSLDAVRQSYAAADRDFEALSATLAAGQDPSPERIDELVVREREVQRHYRDGWRVLQEAIATTSALAAEEERQSTILLGAVACIALLAGILVTWYSNRLLRPLPVLHQRVAAVARGDLSTATGLEVHSDDELGRLARAFERMVAALATRDERLRALRQMQVQIVEGLRAAVVVLAADDSVRSANPAAADVFRPRSGVDADHPFEASWLTRVPGLLDVVREVRAGAPRASLSEVPLDTPSSDEDVAESTRYVDVLVTPFGNAEDGAALIVAEDVTDELATAARLIQTERLAAIGRMAAHVTHEVRNPLSSIGLNVELLDEELGSNDEAGQLLRAVQHEVDRLTEITEQYLRLARVPDPQVRPTPIGELLQRIVGFTAAEMQAHGAEIHLRLADHLPMVSVDESQLRQALLNLLRNAREAMPGGGRIEVETERERDGVRVRVRDHGTGIDRRTRARIFDLFYTTKERGTGLGLALTQQIVVAQGGTIDCRAPENGAGTAFDIWLPSASSASAAPPP